MKLATANSPNAQRTQTGQPIQQAAARLVTTGRELLWFTMGLSTLLGFFYWPFLSGQKSFYQSDLTFYFQPFTSLMVDGFKAGKLPLWNPYLYGGMPQVAVPSPGMFYPPAAVFLTMPFSQAVASYMGLHQLIAGIGTFLLVASLGWGSFAAVICGLAIALCGYMFALSLNYTLVATVAWLPLLLFATRNISADWSKTNVLRMLFASICMALMVAAGRPEVSVPVGLIMAAYVFVSGVSAYLDDRLLKANISATLLRMTALTAGGLAAAPVLLPALEWMRLSPRSHGLELKWVLMWSANWYDCLGMFFAQPLGDLTVLGTKFLDVAASRPHALPFLQSTYLGPVVLTLAIWGMLDRTWRWRWWTLAVFAGALIMALGSYTPIAPFVCKLSPALAAFRYPVKLMIFPMMALCFAAARGASLASQREVTRPSQMITAAIWAGAAVAGLVCLFCPNTALTNNSIFWPHAHNFASPLMHDVQVQFGKSFCLGAGLGALINLFYLAYCENKLNRILFSGLTGMALVASMMMPAIKFLRHEAPGDFYSRPIKLAQQIKPLIGMQPESGAAATAGPRFETRAQSLLFDPLTPGLTFLSDQKVDFQVGFYLFTRQVMLQNSNVDAKIPYAFGYEAAEVGIFKELFSNALGKSSQNRQHNQKYEGDAPMARFLQMTSVSTVTTQSFRNKLETKVEPLDPRFFTLLQDDPNLNVRIYRTKYCNPRAYFANDLAWQTKWPEFFKMFLDAKDTNPLQKTYLAEDPDIESMLQGNETATHNSNSAAQGVETIRIIQEENEHIRLSVQTPTRKLLVLTDQYYPGWICTIDGREAQIHLTNFFARGVFVPPGKHTIEYRYDPPSLRLGFFIVGAVACGYLLLLALTAFLQRSRVPNTMSRQWAIQK